MTSASVLPQIPKSTGWPVLFHILIASLVVAILGGPATAALIDCLILPHS